MGQCKQLIIIDESDLTLLLQAIQCFRIAIKNDSRCISYWESLGDAYAGRGSYNSAIRVFQKILELSPENNYALLQIASVKTVPHSKINKKT